MSRFLLVVNALKKIWFQLLVLFLLLTSHLYLEFQPESKGYLVYRRVLSFLAVWVVAWILSRVLELVHHSAWVSSKLAPHFRPLVFVFFRIVIYVTAFLVALDTVGVSITPLVASLGVGSIAVGLALQDTLGNLFSGFYLYLDRPIAAGDWIQLDTGIEGKVVRIGWRSTHLLVSGVNHVVLPNSKLSSSMITNYSIPHPEVSAVVAFGVGYGSDLEKVEHVLGNTAREVVEKYTGGVREFFPLVRMKRFGESGIDVEVTVRVKTFDDRVEIEHFLIKALKAACEREKIDIPYPHRVVRHLN